MAPEAARKPLYAASIRPRPRRDGTSAFDVRYRQDGQSRTQAFETLKAAEKWAGVVRAVGPAEARAFLAMDTAPGTPTVTEYVERYIATKSGIEPKTIEHYRMFMRLHIGPVLGHLPLDAVSKEAIAAWINLMAEQGASSKSIKNRHAFLSAMFENAVEDNLIDRNPCAKSKMPETERREMVFLSPDEFTELLSYIPAKSQPLVLFLAATGCRWGEATALRPSDFDLTARDKHGVPTPSVRISRAWKSAASRGWYIGPPKTPRSKRVVKLPPEIIPMLETLLRAGTEYVFTNQLGNPVRQQNFFEGSWAPARRLVNGLPAHAKSKVDPKRPWVARAQGVWDGREPASKPLGKWPRVHDLRHSNVGWLLGEGVGIDVISRRLGHESIQTTMDIYGHVAQDRLAAAGYAIGVALSGALPQIEV